MRTVIDINSNDNSLFVTEQCNNRCLMCSQPPSSKNDIEELFRKNISTIEAAPKELLDIGITGGEPTILGGKLVELIEKIEKELPNAIIHMLSNGRAFANPVYTSLLSTYSDRLLIGIPLHSDYPNDHDYVAQAEGAYNETMKGLYNLAKHDISIELRIVISKQNYRRLPQLASFIYKNLPFVRCISFMGLEIIGYAIKNFDKIWVDPVEYQDELEEAVIDLATCQMDVSVFNLPHCLLKPSLHEFARKSISDWKVKYLPICNKCNLKDECCGLFATSRIQSNNIKNLV